MKESIGGTQIFIIVIALILLFTGIMAFTLNHSNAFAVKDQLVSLIESNNGIDNISDQISAVLSKNSYRSTGSCADRGNTVFSCSRDGKCVLGRSNNASFCIVQIQTSGKNSNYYDSGTLTGYYYQIVVFYSIDFPVLKSIFRFKTIGQTRVLYS